MDLELSGKVAVVTGASKGIGLAITRALVDEGALVVAGARGTDSLEGIERRHRGGGRPRGARRPGAAGRARARRARPRRRARQQRRRRAAAPRGLPRHQRRGVRVGDADELLHRAARHPRRASPHGRGGRRGDRQRRLGQRLLPARRRDDRLRRGQGRAAEPDQVAGAGVRREGHPRQLRLPRPGQHRPLARRARRGRDRRGGDRASTRTRRARRSSRASAASPPAASRRPRRSPRSSSCSPRSAPPTSPAPTTSSTAA